MRRSAALAAPLRGLLLLDPNERLSATALQSLLVQVPARGEHARLCVRAPLAY